MESVGVNLQFPPAAFALLLAVTLEGGHASVEQMIHTLAMDEARAFCAAHASETTPELSELFTVTQK